MDEDNPHGGGVAWQDGNQIAFKRGMDYKQIHALQESGIITYPYLLHFRWATHGDKIGQLTHPFPVGPRALFGELSGRCDSVLIHNGTWGRYERAIPLNAEYPDEILDEMSDTAIAAWLLATDPAILEEVPWATAHAFIKDGAMDITTRGTWTEKEGNWYSNLTWVPGQYIGCWSRAAEEWYGNYASTFPAAESKFKGYVQHDGPALKDPCETCKFYYCQCKFGNRTCSVTQPSHSAYDEIPLLTPRDKELTWEEYVRAKYGDEVASQVSADEGFEELYAVEMADDSNIVSEDFETVNRAIERQRIING